MAAGTPLDDAKHEAFARAYIETGGDLVLSYQWVSPSAKPVTAKRMAKKWLEIPNVQTRIAEMQEAARERSEITVEDCIAEFIADRNAARTERQLNVAVKATESIAKILGFWVDKHQHDVTMSVTDAERTIALLSAKYAKGKKS